MLTFHFQKLSQYTKTRQTDRVREARAAQTARESKVLCFNLMEERKTNQLGIEQNQGSTNLLLSVIPYTIHVPKILKLNDADRNTAGLDYEICATLTEITQHITT